MKNQNIPKSRRLAVSLSIALLGSVVFLTGCGPSFSQDSCRAAVVEDAKTDAVVNVPDKRWAFIVRKPDGSVWIYKTMKGNSPEVTERLMLFSPLTNAVMSDAPQSSARSDSSRTTGT